MDNEPRPASPETLHSILVAAHSFLESGGFSLDERTVRISHELEENFDLTKVSVSRLDNGGVLLCHVGRPATPEIPVRYTEYQIYENGTVKHIVVESGYTDDELDVLFKQELAEAEWLDELVRLDTEGLLNEEEERVRVENVLQNVDDTLRRTIEARSLLNSSVNAEEREEAEQLLDAIYEEIDEKQKNLTNTPPRSTQLSDELRDYSEYYMRLLDAQSAVMIAKARALNRGIRSASEQFDANALVEGSTISEAEAWELLRIFDRVAEF